jgi:hypothetical protein
MPEQKYFDYIVALSKLNSNPNDDINKRVDEVLKTERTENRPSGPVELDRQPPEELGEQKRTVNFNGREYTI